MKYEYIRINKEDMESILFFLECFRSYASSIQILKIGHFDKLENIISKLKAKSWKMKTNTKGAKDAHARRK